MQSWGRDREVEKPKTVTGKRNAAVAHAETVFVQVMQHAEASRVLYGDSAPLRAPLLAAARTIRELIDLMPKGGK